MMGYPHKLSRGNRTNQRGSLPVLVKIAVLLFSGFLWAIYPSAGSASGQTKFHTDANRIVDDSGVTMVFKGLNALDPIAQETFDDPSQTGTWNEGYYRKMAEWGANLVRVPIHPNVWRDTDTDVKLGILDKTIEWIGANNMYAIIDFHSIGFLPDGTFEATYYETTKSEVKEFWKTVAARYKDNNVVAFYDIFNEPVNLAHSNDEYNSEVSSADWEAWKKEAEEIIDVIRTYDQDAVVIVGGVRWSYDLSQVAANPVAKANVVYAAHPYPGSSDFLPWDEAFGKTSEQYPVLASEFGFTDEKTNNNILVEFPSLAQDNDPDFNNPNYVEATYTRGLYRDDIIKFLGNRGIGWTAFSFSPIWSPVLLKNWSFTPTEAGKFFMGQLQAE